MPAGFDVGRLVALVAIAALVVFVAYVVGSTVIELHRLDVVLSEVQSTYNR